MISLSNKILIPIVTMISIESFSYVIGHIILYCAKHYYQQYEHRLKCQRFYLFLDVISV
jgi:hypothetical protein